MVHAPIPKVNPSTQEVLERGDCPDVNKIGYDGDAQGEYCGLPFLMNERYFETCTRVRERPDGAVVTEDEYWCPSPEERFCDESFGISNLKHKSRVGILGICEMYLDM